jgi:predicted  nucleic acid-binding Zn-ribbon protein
MATIKLHANKINQMSSLINDVKKSVSDYKSELSSLKTKTLKINSSVCNVDDVISSIQASTQTQDQTITSLEDLQKNSEQFISDVVQTDNKVADLINQRKKDFYKEYSHLKPEYEKNWWEKSKLKKLGQWCRDNWKLVGTIILQLQ